MLVDRGGGEDYCDEMDGMIADDSRDRRGVSRYSGKCQSQYLIDEVHIGPPPS
jgi:hypothetical protein